MSLVYNLFLNTVRKVKLIVYNHLYRRESETKIYKSKDSEKAIKTRINILKNFLIIIKKSFSNNDS